MEEAWPEEHLAKLSVNALIGLWARNVDLVYLMRASNNQLDGHGCQYCQTFVDAAGQTHWDHIFVTQLFSNASHRPAWDFVMAAEYCAVARICQMLAEVPVRYLKFLKTDAWACRICPRSTGRRWSGSRACATPTARRSTGASRSSSCGATTSSRRSRPGRRSPAAGSESRSRWPTACRGAACCHRAARRRQNAPREAHRGAAAGGRRCGAAGLENPLRGAELGAASADRRPLGAPHGAQRPLPARLAGGRGGHPDGHGPLGRRGLRFLLMGDFRQLPAVLDSFAGARVERPLKDCDLLRDLAGGYCHELTENRRSDERIFQFISWLRVGEAEEVPLAEAVRVARREFPRPAGEEPDVCLVLSHAHRVQINERENRRLAPADAVVIEHQAPGAPTTNAPQTMRVWPGLRLVGAGGKVAKGTFVRVAEADAERVTLDGGQQFTHAELLRRMHAALPRHYLRELPGADAPRPGVAARRGHAALQPAAPLRRRQPGHQLRAAERALRGSNPAQLWGWPTNDGPAVGPIKAIKFVKPSWRGRNAA